MMQYTKEAIRALLSLTLTRGEVTINTVRAILNALDNRNMRVLTREELVWFYNVPTHLIPEDCVISQADGNGARTGGDANPSPFSWVKVGDTVAPPLQRMMARAFNAWLKEYTDNPSGFSSIQDDIDEQLRSLADGREPDYGNRCAALLMKYMDTADRFYSDQTKDVGCECSKGNSSSEPEHQRLVTVIPGARNSEGALPVQGTQVLDGDGKPIEGVTKVVLTAEANDVWKAVIHCHVRPVRMDGLVDVTAVDDESRRFVPFAPIVI